jgi:ABC-type transport system substrate-binding protein
MPMFFWNWISFTNDPYYGFNFLVQTGQGTNYANYSNPTVDALIQKGMYEPSPTKRATISRTIQKTVAADAFAIGLAQPDSIVALRSNVHGWMQYPDLNARYYTLWKD